MVAPERDLDLEAARVHARIDGLSIQTVIDPRDLPAASVRGVVRRHLR